MNSSVKKTTSLITLIGGIAAMAFALYLDFTGSENAFRGTLLIAGAVLALFGVYFYPTRKHRRIINFIFLFPLIFAFAVTVLIPFICGIFYSLTDWNGVKVTQFVGLDNYIKMFQSKDYVYSFAVTFIFTVVNMIAVNIAAFALALLCTSKVKGKNIYRAAFFVPNLIGGIVLGYVWQFIFNKVMTTVIAGSVSMLTDPNMALAAILIVSCWQYAGYIMMIYVTGLQGVPKDVLEASSVDGANSWTTLRKIKMPMIANTFTVCIFLTLVNSFKQFDLNLAITNGAPSRIIAEKPSSPQNFWLCISTRRRSARISMPAVRQRRSYSLLSWRSYP